MKNGIILCLLGLFCGLSAQSSNPFQIAGPKPGSSMVSNELVVTVDGIDELADGYQYVFPGPGVKYVHPNSTIILRLEKISPEELTNLETVIQVTGEESGAHSGQTSIASDERTLIFTPEKAYNSGEKVKVSIDPCLSEFNVNTLEPLHFEFTVLEESVIKNSHPEEANPGIPGRKKSSGSYQPMIMSNGVSVPADFPHVNITNSKNPSSEYLFINNWGSPHYSIIFNTLGEPVWYWKTPDRRDDFKVQSNGWITMLVEDGYGGNGPGFIALNQNFEFIKSMRTSNGYSTDEHDFYMLQDNGYILIGQRETTVDMSNYVSGGQTDAIVRETCIQEFTADDQLIFIWRAWDHFDIRDLELESLTANSIRFPHINAIYTDDDGHILLSSRHLSEISKIHRQSGEFIWRLSGIPGSPHNDFQFVSDPLNGFRNQHAIRSLGNGTYTLFDNGNLHSPPISRAVEYEIDTVHMTATLVQEQRSEYDRSFVSQMGNSQRLPNGNMHINWAYGNVLPIATEVTPAGEIVFEMWFEKGDRCYRSFRYPWEGISPVPYLLLEPQTNKLILIFNKFDDNNVDYYNIYGGTSPHPISLIDISRSTLKSLTDLQNGIHYYFRVTAVDKNGLESGYSNEEDVIIRDMEPGTNLIINGDFTYALDAWIWKVDSSASAEIQAGDSVCNFEIEDGGSNFIDVQLRQNNIPLILGQNYLLEFDAWADENRIVEVMLGEDHPPYTDYSRLGYTALNTGSKRFTYSFEMNESTDLNARMLISAGGSAENIYMDNISLKIDAPSMTENRFKTDSKFLLYPNYPNPFSSSTIIEYDIPETSFVKLTIYNSLGQKLADYINAKQIAGSYSREIQLGNYGSGVYFYSLEAKALHSAKCYHKTNRMIQVFQ